MICSELGQLPPQTSVIPAENRIKRIIPGGARARIRLAGRGAECCQPLRLLASPYTARGVPRFAQLSPRRACVLVAPQSQALPRRTHGARHTVRGAPAHEMRSARTRCVHFCQCGCTRLRPGGGQAHHNATFGTPLHARQALAAWSYNRPSRERSSPFALPVARVRR